MKTPKDVKAFVQALQAMPAMEAVFNPWRDIDPENDLGPSSPEIRADHLTRYLSERVGRAKLVLCAEALGYQGGHFSGIAMTSERILLGHLSKRGVQSADVIAGGGARTSREGKLTPANGATEPTATVVWGAIKKAGLDPREVVLWNAFPLHPMKRAGGWLTNRKPNKLELEIGRPRLEQLLALFPRARTVAIGDVAEDLLGKLNLPVHAKLRHPAFGGATKFRDGFRHLAL